MVALLHGLDPTAGSNLEKQTSAPPPRKAVFAKDAAIPVERGPSHNIHTKTRRIELPEVGDKRLKTLLHTVTQLRAEPFDRQILDELGQNLRLICKLSVSRQNL